MWRRVPFFVGGGIALGVLVWFFGMSTTADIPARAGEIASTSFDQPPVYIGSLDLTREVKTSRPFALTFHEGNLLVSFVGSDEIAEYAPDLKRFRSIHVRGGQSASLTSLVVESDRLYAADFRSGELLVAEYPGGKLLNAFGLLPDESTPMKLFGLAYASGSLYASNSQSNQMLAISTQAVPGVREEGELLVAFPSAPIKDFQLSFPTFAAVTPDGRLLVSDVGHKEIKAFTCSGRPAHRFDTSGAAAFSVPMGIAMDDLQSPDLSALADSVFDPSGIYHQGRIHVVDAGQSSVKVFNAFGKYMLTYGRELRQPHGIAIDQDRNLVFVADAELQCIAVYKY